MRCFDMPCQIFFVDEYENDAQSTHRCCGGTVHIKMATLYVAASALILCAFNIASICFGIYSVNFTLDVTLIIINTITATMIFYALYYEKATFLIPFIVTSEKVKNKINKIRFILKYNKRMMMKLYF
uniref:Uncharacterized protein n=1 Tax=Wuchereria bancrofti TaxID=6293 RepID=A0AAF5Q6H9_WUCBA